MSKPSGPSTMYSGTPCDVCGGPTLELKFGSIWCSDEDAHAGGHFVTRVAFERNPNKPNWRDAGRKTAPIAPRTFRSQTPATVQKVSTPKPAFSGGYDDFVKGDD